MSWEMIIIQILFNMYFYYLLNNYYNMYFKHKLKAIENSLGA